ncbi:hypothetical protein EDB85DRAFT_844484 [Lactarius pseudohatsudake]|nr:hypothetical protein EDB85DRAFT_844484 [Lactarius pseudohatsudake]
MLRFLVPSLTLATTRGITPTVRILFFSILSRGLTTSFNFLLDDSISPDNFKLTQLSEANVSAVSSLRRAAAARSAGSSATRSSRMSTLSSVLTCRARDHGRFADAHDRLREAADRSAIHDLLMPTHHLVASW